MRCLCLFGLALCLTIAAGERTMFPEDPEAFDIDQKASASTNTDEKSAPSITTFPESNTERQGRVIDHHIKKYVQGVQFPGAKAPKEAYQPAGDRGGSFSLPSTSSAIPDPRNVITNLLSLQRLGGFSDLMGSFSNAGQVSQLLSNVNMTEVGRASNRVANELSKTLKLDVFAVGKALAGAGAAVGSMVFIGGLAAMIMHGMGFFNYSPALYNDIYPYGPNTYTSAQQAAIAAAHGHLPPHLRNQQNNQQLYQSRSAKAAFFDTKKPENPNLIPAISELMNVLSKSVEQVGNNQRELLKKRR